MPKSVFKDGDINWTIVTMVEHTFSNLNTTNVMLSLNDSNSSMTKIIKDK